MRTLFRRVLTVLILLMGAMWACQQLLTSNYRPADRYVLSVTEAGDGSGRGGTWRFIVDDMLKARLDSSPARMEDALEKLRSARGGLKIEATIRFEQAHRTWSAQRDEAGAVTLSGKAATLEDVAARIVADNSRLRPAKAATIQEVLDANIPMPTRSKVSLPGYSYKQAFPEANDQPEIVITQYAEAPMVRWLRDANAVPADANELARWKEWRHEYPASLPPVEERLPRNPAVVVGPDGVGQYGGVWRRCTTGMFDFDTKLCTESFMKHDPSGNIQPCLAYKWESSPDNRVYTLYLRKGHRWSDGQPFTTEDILWTCNVVIGSPTFEPPDWMQARDGAQLLYEDDVADWPALARRIVREANEGPSAGRQIRELGEARLWNLLGVMAETGAAKAGAEKNGTAETARPDAAIGLKDAPAIATAELNGLFRNPAFYSPRAFAKLDANLELRQLEAVGASRLDGNDLDRLLLMLERGDILTKVTGKEPNTIFSPAFRDDPNFPTQSEVIRLNLLLFRSVYRDLVVQPSKDRVRVEAVPDETGDTSHVIRFTFRKPNSLFIEHTPTFMFYRFLGGCKHFSAPMRPEGCDVLADTDIYDWGGLAGAITREAEANAPSPGKRLWEGLDANVRQSLKASPPNGDSPDDYKNRIIQALNEVLSGRQFYDKESFAGISAAECRKQMHWNDDEKRQMGYAEVFRDASVENQYRDWLVVEDLQRRADSNGPASLSDAEHLKLNVAMFRAACSKDVDNPLVARTRTDGLDRAAANHPLRYDSWISRADDARNYHPLYNPHPPTLCPWRIVSQKDDPEILAVRNPYYYKVDANGNQLPYIDAMRTTISDQKQIRILKLKSGNVDCQSREITFDEYPVLKQNEAIGDYEVRLWPNDYCGEVCFGPLQAHRNPMFAKANEDPNFRYALSLALNRREIIDVVFCGVGEPAQFSIPKGSRYYSESMAGNYVKYDPAAAGRLLDAMGLDKRDENGRRLFWNGEPFILQVNFVQDLVPTQVVELACKYWQDIGIDARMMLRTGNMLYRLEELGDSDLEVAKEGGNYFGPFPPSSYYPSDPAESTQWYQWANYMRNGGRLGWPPPQRIMELERLWQVMVEAPDVSAKMAGWKAITDRFTRDLPIISVMTSPGKIIYVRNGFKNVPKIALAGWIAHEPGNACPECFFFDRNYKRPETNSK